MTRHLLIGLINPAIICVLSSATVAQTSYEPVQVPAASKSLLQEGSPRAGGQNPSSGFGEPRDRLPTPLPTILVGKDEQVGKIRDIRGIDGYRSAKGGGSNNLISVTPKSYGEPVLVVSDHGGKLKELKVRGVDAPLEVSATMLNDKQLYVIGSGIVGQEWRGRVWVEREPEENVLEDVVALNAPNGETRGVSATVVSRQKSELAALFLLMTKGGATYPGVIRISEDSKAKWGRVYIDGTKDQKAYALLDWKEQDALLAVGSAEGKPWLLKIDASSGIPLQSRKFGEVQGALSSIVRQTDGFILVGWRAAEEKSRDLLAIKIDFDGTIKWERLCGGRANDAGTIALPASDGGVIIGGETRSKYSVSKRQDIEFSPHSSEGSSEGWVLRLDGQGYVVWERKVGGGAVVALQSANKAILARLNGGSIFELELEQNGVQQHFDWSGVHSWTSGMSNLAPFGRSNPLLEVALTCLRPPEPSSPMILSNQTEIVKRSVHDRRMRNDNPFK